MTQGKPHAVILTETHRELSPFEISNYSSISGCETPGRGGVALLIRKVFPHIPQKFSSRNESCWTVLNINRVAIFIRAVYITPNSAHELHSFVDQLEEAAVPSCKHRLEPLLAGDMNARHSMWGNKITNDLGRILVDALHDSCRNLDVLNHGQPIFVSVNGNSIIDLYVISEKLKAIASFTAVDQKVELFTGAPAMGHLPTWLHLKGKDNEEAEVVKDLDKANWREFYRRIERELASEALNIWTMNAEESWLSLKQAIEIASEEEIPRKKICCFSKPFWCKELTIKSQELRTARKNYRFRNQLTI